MEKLSLISSQVLIAELQTHLEISVVLIPQLTQEIYQK